MDILTLVHTGTTNVMRMCKQWDSFPLDPSGHHATTILSCHLCSLSTLTTFKMAGLKATISYGWKILRQGLLIESEQRITSAVAVYLGCRHIVTSVKLPAGITVTTMTYDMEGFLKS